MMDILPWVIYTLTGILSIGAILLAMPVFRANDQKFDLLIGRIGLVCASVYTLFVGYILCSIVLIKWGAI